MKNLLIKFLIIFVIFVVIISFTTNFLTTPRQEEIRPIYAKTIEEALRRGRNDVKTIIHKEDMASGKLVFYLPFVRSDVEAASELAVEYLERTWRGWKFAYKGGSYSAGEPAAVHYSEFWKYNDSKTPVPLLYGEVFAPEIQALFIINKNTGRKKEAKIIEIEKIAEMTRDMRIWYVELDDNNIANILIQGIDINGNELFVEDTNHGFVGYENLPFGAQ